VRLLGHEHIPSLRPIEHIDWLGILDTESVILVVSTTVIRELNRHKDFPSSPKARERAAAALIKLHGWSEQEPPIMIRTSVELQFRERDPVIDFDSELLSRDIPDDHLIATIIEHRAENGGDLILITSDLGLKLKARSHQIHPVQLPAELRLADEPLETEKRIRYLEAEVRRLQNATPKLRLLFKTKENRIHLAFNTTENSDPEDVEKSMTEIRSEYPRMEHPKPEGKLTAEADILLVPASWSVSAEEIDRYNAELEAYLTAFEKHLQRLQSLQDLRARSLPRPDNHKRRLLPC
jgi:PIN domain